MVFSLANITIFSLPLIYYYFYVNYGLSFKDTLKFENTPTETRNIFLLSAVLFGISIVGYYSFKPILNYNLIFGKLFSDSLSLNGYFLFSILIILIYPLFNEVFFRGFIFLNLYSKGLHTQAYLISSLFFSLTSTLSLYSFFNDINYFLVFVLIFIIIFLYSLLLCFTTSRKLSILNSFLIQWSISLAFCTMGYLSLY